jgi:hypothetical protein
LSCVGICEGLIQKDFSNTSSTISRFEEDNSSLFQGEDNGDLVAISYPRYMRDMREDLKG